MPEDKKKSLDSDLTKIKFSPELGKIVSASSEKPTPENDCLPQHCPSYPACTEEGSCSYLMPEHITKYLLDLETNKSSEKK